MQGAETPRQLRWCHHLHHTSLRSAHPQRASVHSHRMRDATTTATSFRTHPHSAVLGKAEGKGTEWHGHVSAVTVAPAFRRLGLARSLVDELERVSDKTYKGYFVDLFVRVSNTVAISMYYKFGYNVYRRVLNYYSGEEDAFDMRKALGRDVGRKSIVPLPKPIHANELLAGR